MTQTKAEQLADVLSEWWVPPDKEETLQFCISELRRLSPMEARVKELEDALKTIAQLGNCIDVDCVRIARKALEQTVGANHD
jgi:hypothetical protein